MDAITRRDGIRLNGGMGYEGEAREWYAIRLRDQPAHVGCEVTMGLDAGQPGFTHPTGPAVSDTVRSMMSIESNGKWFAFSSI